MEITIREIKPTDCEEVSRMWLNSSGDAYKDILPIDTIVEDRGPAKTKEYWREYFAPDTRSERIAFIARQSNKTVGLLILGPVNEKDRNNKKFHEVVSEIHSVHIAPGSRQSGIGRRLVKHGFQYLVSQGKFPICVWTLKANTTAIRFYKALKASSLMSDVRERGHQKCYLWDHFAIKRAFPLIQFPEDTLTPRFEGALPLGGSPEATSIAAMSETDGDLLRRSSEGNAYSASPSPSPSPREQFRPSDSDGECTRARSISSPVQIRIALARKKKAPAECGVEDLPSEMGTDYQNPFLAPHCTGTESYSMPVTPSGESPRITRSSSAPH